MKFRTLLATLMVAGATVTAVAQNKETKSSAWFVQPSLGVSYSMGDNKIGDLISPAGQLSVGKNFSEGFAARLSVSGWRGRGGYGENQPGYGFYYGAATVDGLFNLNKIFSSKNANEKKFNTSLVAGLGYNSTFGNRKDGGLMGRVGLQGKYNLNNAFALNVEALYNATGDKWNGQDDHSFDSYVNIMVGLTMRFGKGISWGCPDCDVVYYENYYDEEYVDGLNNKINDLRAELEKEKAKEPKTIVVPAETKAARDHMIAYVHFGLNKTNVEEQEMVSIHEIGQYLQKNPEATVSLIGYADKQTGNTEINAKLAEERAANVAEILQNKFGIAKERMSVSSKGDTEQIFSENAKNRVVKLYTE